MKISVIMCTFCGEKYIKKQLDSIKNQTLSPTEVKIIDDCSSDNTVRIIKNYINEYSLNSWSIFVNIINKGWRINFYDAIKDCDGDIVFFCDQDDIWHLDKIEVMSRTLIKNPDILLLSSEKYLIDSNDKKITKHWLLNYSERYDFKVRKCLLYENLQLLRWKGYVGCSLAAKRELLQYLPFFQLNEYFAHDIWAIDLAAILDGHYHINYPSTDYRIHENNVSFKKSGIVCVKFAREEWLRNRSNYITSFLDGLKKIDVKKNLKEVKRLKRAKKFANKRLNLYKKANLLCWISLIKYIDLYIYIRKIEYFVDLIDTLNLRKLFKKDKFLTQ